MKRLMLTELNRDRLDPVESSHSRIDSRWMQLLLDGNDGPLWTLVLALCAVLRDSRFHHPDHLCQQCEHHQLESG